MNDLQTFADRVEIDALRAEYTDAGMMSDFDRLASLFTPDGVLRFTHGPFEAIGRDEVRAKIAQARGHWEFFVQNTHPGALQLDRDTATGRAYMVEFGRFHDGRSMLNYAVYHDRYQRTPDGWKFSERVYEVRYLDHTPLAGAPSGGGESAG